MEKKLNDLKLLLIRRGFNKIQWYHSYSGTMMRFEVDRYNINLPIDCNSVHKIESWIVNVLRVPLETESERIERILHEYTD